MCRAGRCCGSCDQLLCALFFLVLLSVSTVSGAGAAGLSIVQPASIDTSLTVPEQCLANASSESAPLLLPEILPDNSCFVKPGGARFTAQSTLIVDIRERREFARFRIPGSIHMPRYALTRKAFLRNRSVLLVGPPHVGLAVPALCAELKRAGMASVKVLDYGIAAWVRSGGKLDGELPDMDELLVLQPKDWYGLRGTRRWLVLTDGGVNDEIQSLFPHAHIDEISDTGDVITRVVDWLADSDGAGGVLVAANAWDARTRKAIKALLARPDLQDIYVLADGIDAYRRFVAMQRAIIERPAGSVLDKKRCAG